jgi:hypothetical protein
MTSPYSARFLGAGLLLGLLAGVGCAAPVDDGTGGGGPTGLGGKTDGVCPEGETCDPAPPSGPVSFVLVSASLPMTNSRGVDWDSLSAGDERLPDPYFVLGTTIEGQPESLVRSAATRNSLEPVLADPEIDWIDDIATLTALHVEVLDDDAITSQIICTAPLPLDQLTALPHMWEVACATGALVIEARAIEGVTP